MKIVPNVGDMDRIIRIVGGVILLLLGLLLKLPLAAGIILVLLGLALVATGYLRFCPLYSVLKIKTLKK
ncbi:MAG: DUF2892 domain-containing protein [Chloroflexi bacterium]|nr:DUF2892 domain-containing protein [Chloroflexota bacterium]